MTYCTLTEDVETVQKVNYIIKADTIHPSITKGLIPVYNLAFLDIENQVRTCKSVKFELDIDISEVVRNTLYVLNTILNRARNDTTNAISQYLYHIRISESVPGKIRVIARGA